MKKVLIIAPDFLPSTYPPALRMKNFIQHLNEFGWTPIVLTVNVQYYEHSIDLESEQLIPKSLRLIRTQAFSFKLTRTFGVGDVSLRSLWHHWQAAQELCKKEKIDLVFVSIPPTFQALLGHRIYKKFGIPYIIDYIDPWVTLNYWNLPQSWRSLKRILSYFLSTLFEPWVLKCANQIVGVSRGTTDQVLSRYPWFPKNKATEIPYGGEPGDFDFVRKNPRKNLLFNHQEDSIHISYVGRGGTDLEPGVKAIFEALKLGLKRSPQIFNRIRLHFIGTTYDPRPKAVTDISNWAKAAGLMGYVDEHPARISYLDALQVLLDSHALLAIGSNLPHYTASKIFPYLLAEKPLLAIFREESSVVKILKETKTGKLVTFGDRGLTQDKVQEITRHLEEILTLPSDNPPATRWGVFENYSARAMTAKLAQVFNHAIAEKII